MSRLLEGNTADLFFHAVLVTVDILPHIIVNISVRRVLVYWLLASWIKRYQQGEGKIWKQIIDYKYRTQHPNIFTCRGLSFLERCPLGSQYCQDWIFLRSR